MLLRYCFVHDVIGVAVRVVTVVTVVAVVGGGDVSSAAADAAIFLNLQNQISSCKLFFSNIATHLILPCS